MKTSASVASVLAHLAVLVGMGLPERRPEAEPPEVLDLRTIELIELPAPVEPPPAVEPAPEPAPEPEPEPEPEPAPAEPEPEPAPAEPEPRPPAPKPKPAPELPAGPEPSPIPAAPSDPAPEDPAPEDPAGEDPAPEQPKTAKPRKLGQRYSNTGRSGGRAQAQTGCSERPSKPVPTQKVAPKFPADVLRSSIAGTLTLRASVDASGAVTKVSVVESPDPSVEGPAQDAFAQWRFEPATACGKAVASTYAKSWKFKGAG